jgi:ABC-type lipoprotein export system ATPase subunit
MIRTEELSRTYQSDEVVTAALNRVNMAVDDGEFVAIMALRVAEKQRS